MAFLAFSPLAPTRCSAPSLVILLLHLLKPRPRAGRCVHAAVVSVLKRRSRRHPWRRLLALLLCLGIGLSLALALGRPEVPALGLAGKRAVLVLDNSPRWRRARDRRSRWSRALGARAATGGAGRIMVRGTMGCAGGRVPQTAQAAERSIVWPWLVWHGALAPLRKTATSKCI